MADKADKRERDKFIKNDIFMWGEGEGEEQYETAPATWYGNIEFKTTNRSLAKFIRFAHIMPPEKLYTLLTKYWGLERPRLVILFLGGSHDLDLPPDVREGFLDGFSKVASTSHTWMISGGLNTGLSKLIGEANHGTNNVCIGIATWGMIANKETLQPTKEEGNRSGDIFPYTSGSHLVKNRAILDNNHNNHTSGSHLVKKGAILDNNHTHFLFVDDKTEGIRGREKEFRISFERYLTEPEGRKSDVLTVYFVFEGGPGTLDSVLYCAVKNCKPCVLVEGSGGVADLLVYTKRNAKEILKNQDGGLHDGLVEKIKEIFPDHTGNEAQVNHFYEILVKCAEVEHMFLITDPKTGMDEAILSAVLFNESERLSDYEKVRLAMLWDRKDIAENKILAPMYAWESRKKGEEEKELQSLMVMAVALNKIDFFKLFLDYGVSLKSVLTRQVLEFLYYYQYEKNSPIKWIVDLEKEGPNFFISKDNFIWRKTFGIACAEEFFDTLVIDRDRKGRLGIDLEIIKKRVALKYLQNFPKDAKVLKDAKVPKDSIMDNLMEIPNESIDEFKSPFQQLFIWALVNNLFDMALFLWQLVDNPIATAIVATEIISGLQEQSLCREWTKADDLSANLACFRRLAVDFMDTCYKENETLSESLVIKNFALFGGKHKGLQYAVATRQEEFIAHNVIQGILEDMWKGFPNMRHIRGRRIFAAIFWPYLLEGMNIQIKDEQTSKEGENQDEGKDDPNNCSQGLINASLDGENTAPFHEKFFHFHAHSPIVRYFEHTLGYILFLMLFAYVAMLKKEVTYLSGSEILLVLTVIGYLVMEIYQLCCINADGSRFNVKSYFSSIWNLFDVLCIVIFIMALIFRCYESTLPAGHLFYAFDVSLWIVRSISILYAHPECGPYVVMIGEMLRDMIAFLMILLIFLLGYGVAVKAILEPTHDDEQMFISVIFKPYFHIFGELFLDGPDKEMTRQGTRKSDSYSYAEYVGLIYLAGYMFIANLLLLNVLIAIFNNTYVRVIENAERIWKFSRYELIVEYAYKRTFWCPPLNLIEQLWIFIRYVLSHFTKISRVLPPSRFIDNEDKANENMESILKEKIHDLESICLIKVIQARGHKEMVKSESK